MFTRQKYLSGMSIEMEEGALLTYVLKLLGQVKLYHWATMSYIHHQALDTLHTTLSEKTDMLVEVYIGRYNKQPLRKMNLTLECNTDTEHLIAYLEDEREQMTKMLSIFDAAPQLQSVIEEMMAAIDKCIYICRLQSN
jgi:hypothetical protein